jgi:hypothetical protein
MHRVHLQDKAVLKAKPKKKEGAGSMNMKKTVSAMLVLLAASAAAFALDISDPIAHWRFDEGSGDIAFDSAGNNHGTLYGNP